jgi:hypothetical protein
VVTRQNPLLETPARQPAATAMAVHELEMTVNASTNWWSIAATPEAARAIGCEVTDDMCFP